MKNFLLKSLVVVLLYLPAQYVYYKYTNKADVTTPLMLKVKNSAESYAKAEIISFGSSVEYMCHPKDEDRRTMTKRLESYLPERKIVGLSQAAFTVKILDAFIKFYHRKVGEVKQFYVIEMNMDQFAMTDNKRFLDRTPERLSYAENIVSAMYRPLSIFNYDYGVLTDKEYKTQEVFLDGEYQGEFDPMFNGQDQTFKEVHTNRYMIQYLYELDESHEKIGYLKSLIKFLQQNDIKCLFYITPFDVESCGKYFEQDLCDKVIDANLKVVTDVFEQNKVPYLNLAKDLPTEAIASTPLAPNGHLKSDGKEYNAKKISEWVKMNLK